MLAVVGRISVPAPQFGDQSLLNAWVERYLNVDARAAECTRIDSHPAAVVGHDVQDNPPFENVGHSKTVREYSIGPRPDGRHIDVCE